MRFLRLVSGLSALGWVVTSGCSSSDKGVGTGVIPSPSTEDDAGVADAGCSDCDDGSEGADGSGSDGTPGGDGGGGGDGDFEECAGSRTEAERTLRPVDIVWVVDSSGSMNDEAATVQANINSFVTSISAAGIPDYRVVMVTKQDFLNVPAPLGTDSAHFLFIDEDVGSKEPLEDLIARLPDYKAFLQADALTHFVVVTDDESDLPSADFLSQMAAGLGTDDFKVHAIASDWHQECLPLNLFCWDAACTSPTNSAASPGKQHYSAADATGGLKFSICTENWDSLFTELAEAVSVSAPIPCELLVPEPEEGDTLDPGLVNVVFTPPDATDGAPIPGVTDAAACGSGAGWYYDDRAAPTKIFLCPTSCTAAEGGGALDIALGCETILQ